MRKRSRWETRSGSDPLSKELQRTTVTKIIRGSTMGLFNPHTLSGSVVVNDIAALTFTDTLPKNTWVHTWATAPGALLYWLCPTNGVAEVINWALLRGFGVEITCMKFSCLCMTAGELMVFVDTVEGLSVCEGLKSTFSCDLHTGPDELWPE